MNNQRLAYPVIVSLAIPFILAPAVSRAVDAPSSDVSTDTNAPPAAAPLETAPTPSATATSTAKTAPAKKSTKHSTFSYTVVSGDTLSALSHKFHCSITDLKKTNHLKSTRLKPGQVLKIPKKTATAEDKPASAKSEQETVAFHSHKAQPVQDFDIPASTFASCPVPIPSDEIDAPEPAPTAEAPSAAVEPAPRETVAAAPVAAPVASDFDSTPHVGPSLYRGFAKEMPAPVTWSDSPPAPKSAHRGVFDLFSPAPAAVDWGARFTQAARDLADRGLSYDDDWCPPGESHAWSMDCSNTTRYLYRETAGIELPRTASDQYYYLHLQNKAWDVPQTASGFADCNYLRANLKPGDLLFWENTYRPERQPPITHVMVFLGTNARGEWIMAGSQSSRGGEHNRSRGGPDIYVFNPTRPCGGYSTWMGLVHHQGRFCAFGRPLEADKAKLAVAAND